MVILCKNDLILDTIYYLNILLKKNYETNCVSNKFAHSRFIANLIN